MRSRWAVVGVAALALALLAGCGGGSGGGGGTTTSTQRAAAMQALGAQYDALQAADPATARQKLAAWLQSRQEFEASGTATDGSVWARFTDGRLAIIPVMRVPAANKGAAVARAHGRAAAPPANLPFDGPAFVGNAMGPAFQDWPVTYRDFLNQLHYDVRSAATTVEGLKSVQGAGVFYIDCHFGEGEERSGWKQPAMWTADLWTAEGDNGNEADLEAGNVVYMYALSSKDPTTHASINEWHYAITGRFVQKYMSFAPKSFVFIDGCSSANSTFRNAIFQKGASVYAGWTDYADDTYAGLAASFLFSRIAGIDWPPSESPPQRPFDWQAVLAEMANENRDYSNPEKSGHLDIQVHPSDDAPMGLLAPSIESMFVHPYEQKLYLYGIFGDNPGENGKVTVAGTPLQILDWSHNAQINLDMITCHIPDSGAGAWGDVQVTVRNHQSNTHQLSHYKGLFTLTHQAGPLKYEIKLTLQFRADLLTWRTAPAQSLNYFDSSVQNNADMASTGEWACSGVYTQDGSTLEWSGGGTGLHNNIDGTGAKQSFIGYAWFHPDQHTMDVAVSGGIENGLTMTSTDSNGNRSSTTQSIIYGLDTFAGKYGYNPSYATVQLGSDYGIQKGSAPAAQTMPQLLGMDTATLSWDAIACDSPPSDSAARGARRPPSRK